MLNRNHVDLFSGIGGFALACEWVGVGTIAFAEIDNYASKVLAKNFPEITNYGDVRNVPAIKSVWLVTGGVPCQPASIAGKRQGANDDRWLWPEAIAVVERLKPTWALLENPLGILSLEQPSMSFDLEGYGYFIEAAISGKSDSWALLTGEAEFVFRNITASIEKLGYEVTPIIIPACGVGANHRRYRVWILANATSKGLEGFRRLGEIDEAKVLFSRNSFERNNAYRNDANASSERCEWQQHSPPPITIRKGYNTGLASEDELSRFAESELLRVDDGISRPMDRDRIRCLGNAIVPAVAYQIIKAMIEAEV